MSSWLERAANRRAISHSVNANDQFSEDSSLEPHYSVQVLAELWRLDESTIRRMFESAPGVLKLGNDRRKKGKREYYILRIPASVAQREYQRRLIAAADRQGA